MSRRYRLAELPVRSPHIEHRAPNAIQPFSKAAFDPNDREILRRIDTPRPSQRTRQAARTTITTSTT